MSRLSGQRRTRGKEGRKEGKKQGRTRRQGRHATPLGRVGRRAEAHTDIRTDTGCKIADNRKRANAISDTVAKLRTHVEVAARIDPHVAVLGVHVEHRGVVPAERAVSGKQKKQKPNTRKAETTAQTAQTAQTVALISTTLQELHRPEHAVHHDARTLGWERERETGSKPRGSITVPPKKGMCCQS